MASIGEAWAIVSPTETRRACLVFDKVYHWPRFELFPGAMHDDGDNSIEEIVFKPLAGTNWRPPASLSFGDEDDEKLFEPIADEIRMNVFRKIGGGRFDPDPAVFAAAIKGVAERHAHLGRTVYYSGPTSEFARDFQAANASCARFAAIISDIPIVESRSLEWNQVVEFRKDKENAKKYRALRNWVLDAVQAETVEQAKELIEERVDKYKEAVKAWRFNTTAGAIKNVIEFKNLSKDSLGALVGKEIDPVWGPIVATLIAVSADTFHYVVDQMGELRKIHDEYRQIAYLNDVQSLLKGSRISEIWRRVKAKFSGDR
jgi:hypothetical protein